MLDGRQVGRLLAHKRDDDRIWPHQPPHRAAKDGNGLAQPCQNGDMAATPKRITLSEPGLAGSYELVERRDDGSLVLRPATERLGADRCHRGRPPAPDGRATFSYGEEMRPGEPHVIWRRVGTHDVLRDP
jgi:hypothetical protein